MVYIQEVKAKPCAYDMLRDHKYEYSPKQFAIKWEDIKRNVMLSKKKNCLKRLCMK